MEEEEEDDLSPPPPDPTALALVITEHPTRRRYHIQVKTRTGMYFSCVPTWGWMFRNNRVHIDNHSSARLDTVQSIGIYGLSDLEATIYDVVEQVAHLQNLKMLILVGTQF